MRLLNAAVRIHLLELRDAIQVSPDGLHYPFHVVPLENPVQITLYCRRRGPRFRCRSALPAHGSCDRNASSPVPKPPAPLGLGPRSRGLAQETQRRGQHRAGLRRARSLLFGRCCRCGLCWVVDAAPLLSALLALPRRVTDAASFTAGRIGLLSQPCALAGRRRDARKLRGGITDAAAAAADGWQHRTPLVTGGPGGRPSPPSRAPLLPRAAAARAVVGALVSGSLLAFLPRARRRLSHVLEDL